MRITVFTPAYNRAYTLSRTYNSMKQQECKDFLWLIVDDGSTDNTRSLVNSWLKEDNGFEIKYIYKKNGGMHTAHNVAFDNIETELCVCIDSDDALAENAISNILEFWDKHRSDDLAGFAGLDAFFDGTVFGKDLADVDGRIVPFEELRARGDKKYIFRTEIIKQYPKYPEFEGENLVPLGTLYYEIDQKYHFLAYNKILANIEYMEDGSTRNIFKQYMRSPQGFGYSRQVYLKYSKGFKKRFKLCTHYVSSCLLSKGKLKILDTNAKAMTLFAIPAGLILSLVIRAKAWRL